MTERERKIVAALAADGQTVNRWFRAHEVNRPRWGDTASVLGRMARKGWLLREPLPVERPRRPIREIWRYKLTAAGLRAYCGRGEQ